MMGFEWFKFKKWLWTTVVKKRGPDKAYAKYLANFNRVQANAADSALQNELDVKAMTKDEFIRVWNGTSQSKAGKNKQGKCKPGCCS